MSGDPNTQYFMKLDNKAQRRIVEYNPDFTQSGPRHRTLWTCQLTVTIPNAAQRVFTGQGSTQIQAKDAANQEALEWLAMYGL